MKQRVGSPVREVCARNASSEGAFAKGGLLQQNPLWTALHQDVFQNHKKEELHMSRVIPLRRLLTVCLASVFLVAAVVGQPAFGEPKPKPKPGKPSGGYIAIDFHQHTTYTDGSNPIATVMAKNEEFGLDWWANSEHGGGFTRDGYGPVLPFGPYDTGEYCRFWDDPEVYPANLILGKEEFSGGHRKMWRWQSIRDFSFVDVLDARETYGKPIVQGLEWNMPGHEHCSTGIIGDQFDEIAPNASAMAEFEYLFDAGDKDITGGLEQGWVGKNTTNDHAKAVDAAAWMQSYYPLDSWMIPAHPERRATYRIEHFRDLNNAAPTVCFGFESMPGHQKDPQRGSYSSSSVGGGTYGGCGIFAAKVGGLWDALLGEGRHWWLFASSDFHATDDDFWPGEYQKTYVQVADPDDPWSIVDGMRSGNVFVVEGDLISALNFTVQYRNNEATMGETLIVEEKEHGKSQGKGAKPEPDGTQVKVTIRFQSPSHNNNGDRVRVDHIDLIAGDVTGIVPPTSPDYTKATNPTARVLARFGARDWQTDKKGWNVIVYHTRIQKDTYFRLRGTNNAIDSAEIADRVTGDPALDVPGENTPAATWADLWFYSNPIFVDVR